MKNKNNAGWTRTSGDLRNNKGANLFSEISCTLFNGKHTTTYKYCFFKSILDNLYNFDENMSLSFEKIGEVLATVYWNMIAVHKMPQMPNYNTGAKCSIEKIINDEITSKPNLDSIHFCSLYISDRKRIIKKITSEFSKYVVGAFYSDTSGMIYGFSKKEKRIWCNEYSLEFLRKNKTILEQVNYYQWLKMIEQILNKNNADIKNISCLLENITKRIDLSSFKKDLLNLGDVKTCFYCGKPLSNKCHLDHVIPWDYLKSDNLWNFVFACPKCNTSKNNKMPSKEFLLGLQKRNQELKIDSPDIIGIAETAVMNGVKGDWRPK